MSRGVEEEEDYHYPEIGPQSFRQSGDDTPADQVEPPPQQHPAVDVAEEPLPIHGWWLKRKWPRLVLRNGHLGPCSYIQ